MSFPVPDPEKDAQTRVGSTLNGKWRIDHLIDVGGMGAVFAATHRNGRRVAIKVLHKQYALDREVRRRFLREGYVANKIEHPGALAIIDDDTAEDGAPFLVMELLEGDSLREWIEHAGGTLPIQDVIAVAGQVLEVLAVAHAAGIVHRDIKPANIFVTKTGHTKVLDFGLARIRDASMSLIPTAAGIVMGTSGYMPPEQARGKVDLVDGRVDIFAVGAVMFRALTGRHIHDAPTPHDRLILAMSQPVAPLRTVRADVPASLAASVDKALAFAREDRWHDARAMFDSLRGVYEELKRHAPAATAQAASGASTAPVSVSRMTEEEPPSLVVDVTFGEEHSAQLAREQKRSREIIDGLSRISILVEGE